MNQRERADLALRENELALACGKTISQTIMISYEN